MSQSSKDIEHDFDDRSHDFFKLDYEKSLEIIKQLHEQKITYQKFYVSLAASIVTLSILIFRLTPSGQVKGIYTDNLVGLLFILSGVIGYIAIKNLVSIRCNEIFFNNLIIGIRRIHIRELKLTNYANLKFVCANDRRSADYISILGCGIINLFMLIIGMLLVFPNGNPIQLAVVIGLVAIVYGVLHAFSIEKVLSHGIQPEIDPGSCANSNG